MSWPYANECSVTRAYEIADDCMRAQFLSASTSTDDGYEMEDESAREAARWLIARGIATTARGRVFLIEPPVEDE